MNIQISDTKYVAFRKYIYVVWPYFQSRWTMAVFQFLWRGEMFSRSWMKNPKSTGQARSVFQKWKPKNLWFTDHLRSWGFLCENRQGTTCAHSIHLISSANPIPDISDPEISWKWNLNMQIKQLLFTRMPSLHILWFVKISCYVFSRAPKALPCHPEI